jgi:DNA (cytosine-5)-methyltransferase 1
VRTPLEESFVVELFAGPGGMSEGIKLAGIDPALTIGIELSQDACDTAMKAGHPRLNADIKTLDPSTVARQYGFPTGMHGSPPCPGFSASGKGLGRKDIDVILEAISRIGQGEDPARVLAWLDAVAGDPLSVLCLEPLRWALRLRPEWISMEQVPAVLPLWEAIAVVLRARGYSVWVGFLHAEQYGVPQTRKRAILLATRVGVAYPPRPTHSLFHRDPMRLDSGLRPWVSMAEALAWGMTRRPYLTVAAGTKSGGADPQMIGGSGARAIIRREKEEGYWIEKGIGFPRRYDGIGEVLVINGEEYRARDIRMQGVPAFTITEKARSWMVFDIVQHDDIREARDAVRLPVDDASLLQSFPPDYGWQGTKTSQFQQIGNAVPPLLGEAMARQLVGS